MTKGRLLQLFLLAVFLMSFLPLMIASYSALENEHRRQLAPGMSLFIGTGILAAVALACLVAIQMRTDKTSNTLS
jgi:hypothetical protein